VGEKGLETGGGPGAPQTAGLAPGLMGGGGDPGGTGDSALAPTGGGSGDSALAPTGGGSGASALDRSGSGSGAPTNDNNAVNR
jgi:hypothetical protein